MRILIEEDGRLLSLLGDSALRREDLEVRPVSDPGRAVGPDEADLCLLGPGADSGTLDRLREAGVPASAVSDAGEAASALEVIGVRSRVWERIPLQISSRLVGERVRLEGLTKDVSRGGAFMRCDPILEPGSLVTLRLAAEKGPLELPARVVRTVTRREEGLTGIGLAFGELDPVQQQLLGELLEGPLPVPRNPHLRYRN